ncbi:glycoside hydrolase family 3 N-terminal domain-containing protein [Novosphingobium sp.]|uniref:glycoside hydrolase family 3 protein n=1 Tax=Novosphingobium sp. TaxID=1874826 RepID=UPI00333F9F29
MMFCPPTVRHYTRLAALTALALAVPAQADAPGTAHPGIWPAYHYPVTPDPRSEARIADLIARMTLEEKIGQLVQGDICCTTPDDVRRYHLGAVLNGGNSGPGGDDKAPAPAWLKLADAYWAASTDRSAGGVGIPIIWGTDAVHGHSNIVGATLFPHNIALGATRDPALVERIGAATATEIRVTGLDWTFAPTVTVPRDYRWGRAYEGYSSDPALTSRYVGAMLRGLQGAPDGRDLIAHGKVIASTKHFLGDGATTNGVDQGDAAISETDLRDIHGRPYGPAIEGGVATVMASFSSWQGRKMTGNAGLLTGVLKDRMGFGGFVVSDWNAHGQVEGCSNASCAAAVLAGIDMVMAPDSWKDMVTSLTAQARAGVIPLARIDDAVTRILRVKARLGLFDAGAPSTRPLAGQWNQIGSPAHRALAREAVRKSLVMLKNDGALPIRAGAHLLVAGDGADDIARAAGGWTISWQGTGLTRADFPGATSLWQGLHDAMVAGGGSAELAPDGHFQQRPDVAVVVFGERPYAEFQGDLKSLQLTPDLTAPWDTMRALRAQHIPVVAVMLTGRPLFVNPALNAADAFVVAWLPGSEGEGLADMLVGDAQGHARHALTGQLPTAWPRTARASDGALFPLGYGMTWQQRTRGWKALSDDPAVPPATDVRRWFTNGQAAAGWSLRVSAPDGSQSTRITAVPAQALGGRVQVTAVNTTVQEGARRFAMGPGGPAMIALATPAPIDLSRETNGDVLMLMTVRVAAAPAHLALGMACADATCAANVPVTVPAADRWVRYGLPLKCFAAHGADMTRIAEAFRLSADGPADVTLTEVRLGNDPEEILPCP